MWIPMPILCTIVFVFSRGEGGACQWKGLAGGGNIMVYWFLLLILYVMSLQLQLKKHGQKQFLGYLFTSFFPLHLNKLRKYFSWELLLVYETCFPSKRHYKLLLKWCILFVNVVVIPYYVYIVLIVNLLKNYKIKFDQVYNLINNLKKSKIN